MDLKQKDELEKIEIGIGCGLLSIFIKNIRIFLIALIIIFPKFFHLFSKTIFYLIFNKQKKYLLKQIKWYY